MASTLASDSEEVESAHVRSYNTHTVKSSSSCARIIELKWLIYSRSQQLILTNGSLFLLLCLCVLGDLLLLLNGQRWQEN